MAHYILRRLAYSLLSLFLLSLTIFLFVRVTGDPAMLLVEPGADADLCSVDPGFDVNLFVTTDLRTMTAIWMGLDSVRAAVGAGRLSLTGDPGLAADMQTWLGLSPFARERKLAS